MLRKSLFAMFLVFSALLLTACGPWIRDSQCISGVKDWSGCVTQNEETQAWLRTHGYWETPPAAQQPAVAPAVEQAEPTPTAMPTAPADEPAEPTTGYPEIASPDPSRQPVFPNVAYNNRPALVEYGNAWEDGDYFEDGKGDVDLPQYHYRVITAGKIRIEQLGVSCVASQLTGCLVILVNHFGPTAMFRGAESDNGFTVAGRVWDMSTPELVSLAGQALLDHYIYRMTGSPDGANCGTIDACTGVEWHVVVVGNSVVQTHWSGVYRR